MLQRTPSSTSGGFRPKKIGSEMPVPTPPAPKPAPPKRMTSSGKVIEAADPETGASRLLDGPAAVALAAAERSRRESLERTLRAAGLEPVVVSTARPTVDPLIAFFRRRAKRRSR